MGKAHKPGNVYEPLQILKQFSSVPVFIFYRMFEVKNMVGADGVIEQELTTKEEIKTEKVTNNTGEHQESEWARGVKSRLLSGEKAVVVPDNRIEDDENEIEDDGEEDEIRNEEIAELELMEKELKEIEKEKINIMLSGLGSLSEEEEESIAKLRDELPERERALKNSPVYLREEDKRLKAELEQKEEEKKDKLFDDITGGGDSCEEDEPFSGSDMGQTPTGVCWEPMMFDDLLNEEIDTSDRWHLYPLVKRKGVTLLTGLPSTKKSFLSAMISKYVSETGVKERFQVPGWYKSETPSRVLYIDGEMTDEDVYERIQLLKSDEVENGFFQYIKSSMLMERQESIRRSHPFIPYESKMENEAFQESIKNHCMENDIDLVVWDNLGCLSSLNDSKMEEYAIINKFLIDLRNNGISSLLVHHHNKGDKYRGSSHMLDNIDIHISLSESNGNTRVKFGKFRPKKDTDIVKPTSLIFHGDSFEGTEHKKQKSLSEEEVIIEMLKAGMRNKDIAKKVEKSPAYISKLKKKAGLK